MDFVIIINWYLYICNYYISYIIMLWACRNDSITFRETEPDWHLDIQDDVLEECNKYGNVVHIYVDKTSSEVGGII